jgi:hypothetical protein
MTTVKSNTATAATKTRKHRKTVKEYLKGLKNSKGMGKVAKIVKAAKHGYSQSDIIAAGFNKNTVYRQVREKVTLA